MHPLGSTTQPMAKTENRTIDFIRLILTKPGLSVNERRRFAKPLDPDRNPSEPLVKVKQERLKNWRSLQDLAGDNEKAGAGFRLTELTRYLGNPKIPDVTSPVLSWIINPV